MALKVFTPTINFTNVISSNVFDQLLNSMSDYLNDVIINQVNKLITVGISGSTLPGRANYILRNIGNDAAQTEWVKPDVSLLDNYTVSLDKITPFPRGSIIALNADNVSTNINSSNANQVLVISKNKLPFWSNVDSMHILPESINSTLIQPRSLPKEIFQHGALSAQLLPNSLTPDKILNGSINAAHAFGDYLSVNKLDAQTLANFNSSQIKLGSQNLPKNWINSTSQFNASFRFQNHDFVGVHGQVPFPIAYTSVGWTINHLKNDSIGTYAIKRQSINGNKLIPPFSGFSITTRFSFVNVGTEKLIPTLQNLVNANRNRP